jgi:hypothetical protein
LSTLILLAVITDEWCVHDWICKRVNTIVGRSESEFPLFPALQNKFNLTFFAIGRLSASGRLSAHHCQQQRQHEDEEEEEEEEAPLSEMNKDAIVEESTR